MKRNIKNPLALAWKVYDLENGFDLVLTNKSRGILEIGLKDYILLRSCVPMIFFVKSLSKRIWKLAIRTKRLIG